MSLDAWVLCAPLKVLREDAHPYQETTLATLGRHELGLSRCASGQDCEFFLDGRITYQPGMSGPTRHWFDLCRELGYEPSSHWDWDPALILFQQVVPAMATDWREVPLAFNHLGLPSGVLSLAGLRQTFAEAVSELRKAHPGPTGAKVAEVFEWLPLRAVVFHDDAQLPLDFDGTGPCGRVALWLGIHREHPVVLEGQSPSGPLPHRWVTRGQEGELELEPFFLAAGLEPEMTRSFRPAFTAALEHLCRILEDPLDAYRQTYPVGIPWHQNLRARLLGRTIVEVREGDPSRLVLDDGTEVILEGTLHPARERGRI
jgi:hypothetical protein